MKDFTEVDELNQVHSRIRRLYGMGRLTVAQHNAGIHLLDKLREVLLYPDVAEKVEADHGSSQKQKHQVVQ